jgi:hypothetical protein
MHAGGFETSQHLKQDGRLPDSRFATEQGERARNDATAHHKIEFGEAGFPAGESRWSDLAERRGSDRVRGITGDSPLAR